ncbi:MAG: hypothetical protein F4X65_08280 [Chloroflexi bacterium]|nr:hypothetical protein [Chloroflexota bacterium]
MNISSYNITDVGYHYVGLRVLGSPLPTVRREEQEAAIARSVLKYVSDRSLRLMLPEPRGTFETVGEKVCRELVHFGFAVSAKGVYELTDRGKETLGLLNAGKHIELRRTMARVHLETYDNLREVVQKHFEIGYIWRPIVETSKLEQKGYFRRLLAPTFPEEAHSVADAIRESLQGLGAKKIEDALQEKVVSQALPNIRIRVPLFRSIADRLVSLRLLNIARDSATIEGCEFLKSYSPCANESPPHKWYVPLTVNPPSDSSFTMYFCEPDMTDRGTQECLLDAIEQVFSESLPLGGYYDLPEVRDRVCDVLKIPEATFDEGINQLMDLQPAPLTMGLTYENISGRRKPLVRTRGSSQIYNLLRSG